MSEPTAGMLWTRYVDWCSARVAERFLELSTEEIWELANREPTVSPLPDSPPPSRLAPTYLELVRLLSHRIFEELHLPGFEAWAEQYRADPSAFEAEILGFGTRGGSAPDRAASAP